VLCYQNAEAGSTDSHDCDDALRSERLTQHDRASTLVNRGIIYNTARKLDLALADFDAALAINPDLAEAFLNRGNSRFLQGDSEQALADYTRAIDLKIDRLAAAHYDRALAYGSLGRLMQAKADLQAALASEPDFAPAKTELANVDRLLGAGDG
jgi:tetratricopeptide (TPR) repeat protein